MKEYFRSRQIKAMLPYFLLAVAIIGAHKLISEISILIDFLSQLWSIITPFFYGFLLAYILNIPCSGLQKFFGKSKDSFIRKRKKSFSIILTYVLFILLTILVLNLVLPSIISSIALFFSNFETNIQFFYNHAERFFDYLNNLEIVNIDISMDTILNSIPEFSIENLTGPINALLGVPTAIFRGFLALISSIYILIEKDNFKAFLSRLIKVFISSEISNTIFRHTNKLNSNFKQYIYTQTIDGCILGSLATLVLFWPIRSPFYLTLGIMLGILNYVPYFGSIFGSLIAIAVVGFTQGLTSAIIAAVLLLFLQQLDGNFIQPKLMGGSFSLSPLLIIISITVGGAFAGILGMIAAIPIVAILKDILDELIQYHEHRKGPSDSGNNPSAPT